MTLRVRRSLTIFPIVRRSSIEVKNHSEGGRSNHARVNPPWHGTEPNTLELYVEWIPSKNRIFRLVFLRSASTLRWDSWEGCSCLTVWRGRWSFTARSRFYRRGLSNSCMGLRSMSLCRASKLDGRYCPRPKPSRRSFLPTPWPPCR